MLMKTPAIVAIAATSQDKSSTMRTDFTRKFGVAVPVAGAPMVGSSYAKLAAATAKAGGLGFIGAGQLMSPAGIVT
jgi:NAD(P)H-dependent flavin oxidoreductase YrpB (nitropropane dioxygenase family)